MSFTFPVLTLAASLLAESEGMEFCAEVPEESCFIMTSSRISESRGEGKKEGILAACATCIESGI